MEHVEIEPTAENDGASWHCTTCDQPCASHTPCDHCTDDIWAWFHEQQDSVYGNASG